MAAAPRSNPGISKAVAREVERILKRGSVTRGAEVMALEREFADYVGARHAVAVSSGTAALHLALLAHGIGKGETVLTSPLCMPAVASAIITTGAAPQFVDINAATYTITPSAVEAALAGWGDAAARESQSPTALLAVALFGNPCDLDELAGIAQREGLLLLDVAWESLGARYERKADRRVTACYSFQHGMAVNTGEGGMLVTDDDRLAESVRRMANYGCDCCGRLAGLGFNYRMTELTAALARIQLPEVDSELDLRRCWAEELCWELRNLPGLLTPGHFAEAKPTWQRFALRITPEYGLTPEEVCCRLRADDFAAIHNPLIPLHQHPYLVDNCTDVDVPNAEEVASQLVLLPLEECYDGRKAEKLVRRLRGMR